MAEWCWRKQWFFFFPAFSLSSISVLASSLFFLPFYSLFCFYFSSIYQQCSTLSVVAPWWCCYSRWFTVVASQWQMTVRDGFSPVHFCYSCYSPGFLSSFFFSVFVLSLSGLKINLSLSVFLFFPLSSLVLSSSFFYFLPCLCSSLLLSPKISLPLPRSLLCFSTLVSLPLSLVSSLLSMFCFFSSFLPSLLSLYFSLCFFFQSLSFILNLLSNHPSLVFSLYPSQNLPPLPLFFLSSASQYL
jgi:hypothetical protein